MPGPIARLVGAYVSHRHAFLFYLLLLTLFVAPLLAMFHIEGVLKLVLAINLVASVLGIRNLRLRRVLLPVTVVLIVVAAAPATVINPAWASAVFEFWSLVALLTAGSAVVWVMRARVIRAEHVYAALNVYLLSGIFFGVMHWRVEQRWPGSYLEPSHNISPFHLTDGIYFSFVTIASLGYGDILPVSGVARGLSILEVVSGQLYLTVLIARLVGGYLQHRTPPAE